MQHTNTATMSAVINNTIEMDSWNTERSNEQLRSFIENRFSQFPNTDEGELV